MDIEKMQEAMQAAPIDLAQQVSDFKDRLEIKGCKVRAAQKLIRNALEFAGDEMCQNTLHDLDRFMGRIPYPDNSTDTDPYIAKSKKEVLGLLEVIAPLNTKKTIHRTQGLDFDLGGRQDNYYAWNIVNFGGIIILESAVRMVRSGAKQWDTTTHQTYLLSETFDQPFVFRGSVDEILVSTGIFNLSNFELTGWNAPDLIITIGNIAEKMQTDALAEKCYALLSGTEFVEIKDSWQWVDSKLRTVEVSDIDNFNKWQLIHEQDIECEDDDDPDDLPLKEGRLHIIHSIAGEHIYSAHIILNIDEGEFETSGDHDKLLGQFIGYLGLIKSLLPQAQQNH